MSYLHTKKTFLHLNMDKICEREAAWATFEKNTIFYIIRKEYKISAIYVLKIMCVKLSAKKKNK